jgi:hypothetical protein
MYRLGVSFTSRPIYPREKTFVTHRMGDRVDLRTGLDDMENLDPAGTRTHTHRQKGDFMNLLCHEGLWGTEVELQA